MKILAIETSCDDTGIAILEVKGLFSPKFTVLSNVVSSQQIHQNYGGVFPMMAKREHQNNLVPVLTQALKEAKLLISNSKFLISNQIPNSKLKILKKILEKENNLYEKLVKLLQTYKKPNIDAIAVTYGPGLEPCLWVGVNFTRALSYIWNIPLIPINHIEAHIAVNFLGKTNGNSKSEIRNPKQLLPAICLVVSGGHTQLILMKGIGKYEIIGETCDDAAGECLDKCAKILGLGYPGGPAIAKIAQELIDARRLSIDRRRASINLPRPMINSKDYNFSFSGLKTAVFYKVRDANMDDQFKNEMCVALQDAICDVLIKKTLQAANDFNAKTIILGGGVSANQQLRKQFTEKSEIPVIFPDPKLSTDNGLMIAVATYFNSKPFDKLRINKKASWKTLEANANLRITTNKSPSKPKW